ncbi:MAG: pyridoxamine 5'-phosphate oxidase family protein [Methanosarcinales archaeon]
MNYQDCIKFANENPVCYIATADGAQPRVRGFLLWFADGNGFYFHTGATKDVCKHLKSNPKVEVCFYAPGEPQTTKMMRVAGEVEFLDDIALKTRLLEERPFLKAIATGGPEDPLLVLFRVYNGEAHFWTMEDNMRESEIERITF